MNIGRFRIEAVIIQPIERFLFGVEIGTWEEVFGVLIGFGPGGILIGYLK